MSLVFVLIPIIFLLPPIILFIVGMAIRVKPDTASVSPKEDGDNGTAGAEPSESPENNGFSAQQDRKTIEDKYMAAEDNSSETTGQDGTGTVDVATDMETSSSDDAKPPKAEIATKPPVDNGAGSDANKDVNKKSDQMISTAVFIFIAGLIITVALIVAIKATPLSDWWPDWFFKST